MSTLELQEMQSQLRVVSHSLSAQIAHRNKGITDALFTMAMLREMLEGSADPQRCIRVLDTATTELQKARQDNA